MNPTSDVRCVWCEHCGDDGALRYWCALWKRLLATPKTVPALGSEFSNFNSMQTWGPRSNEKNSECAQAEQYMTE